MLDLSATELRKAAKSVSVVKLQNLLDLALNMDSSGEDVLFREDVKVSLADTGLYAFLMKVVSVVGIGGDEKDREGSQEFFERKERDKDDKKPILGEYTLFIFFSTSLTLSSKPSTPSPSTTQSNFLSPSSFPARPSCDTSSSFASSCTSSTPNSRSLRCGSSKRRVPGAR